MISEWIVSVMTLIMSVTFFVTTFSFPRLAADPGGLSLFPRILCIVAAVFSLIMIAQLLLRNRAGKTSPLASLKTLWRDIWRRGAESDSASQSRRMMLVIVLSILYPWLILRAGFLLATAVYAYILMRLLETRHLPGVLLSICLAAALYLIFVHLLEAYVPTGIWLDLLIN